MAVEDPAAGDRGPGEVRVFRPRLEIVWTRRRGAAHLSVWWLLRQLLTVGLVHVGVLATVYFLLLLGDALFTSYAIVLQDAVFVSYVAQLGWLQRMASDIKAAIAFVVALSALLQMLLFLWRAVLDQRQAPR